jgi:hypothetical protein
VTLPIDGGLLRTAALSGWDVAVIRKLGQQGGESLYNPKTYTPQRQALILRLLDRKLVEKIERDGREFIRLTDFGRNALTQIELADRNAKERVVRA